MLGDARVVGTSRGAVSMTIAALHRMVDGPKRRQRLQALGAVHRFDAEAR
jgi:hypothetical protein